MRYERQVVLEMQPGGATQAPAADGAGAPAAPAAEKKAAAPAPVVDTPAHAHAPAHAATPAHGAAPAHSAAVKKPAPKATENKKTSKSVTAHAAPQKSASGAASRQPAKSSGEAFWVHPPKKGAAAADEGSDTNVKYHPPQVVHP
jgi:hypothetical protein